MNRTAVDPKTDHFAREDEKRRLDFEAKIAVRRAKEQHARTADKIKSLNRMRGGTDRKAVRYILFVFYFFFLFCRQLYFFFF